MAKSAAKKKDADNVVELRKNGPDENAQAAVQLAKLMRADGEFQEAKNNHQSVEKHVEGRGINMKAAKRALKIKRSGKVDEICAELKSLFQYLLVLNVPVAKNQLDMFQTEAQRAPLNERAFEYGLRAGRLGQGDGENPYDPTSEQGQAFIKGLNQGTEDRRLILQMEADEEAELTRDDEGDFPDEGEDDVDEFDTADPAKNAAK